MGQIGPSVQSWQSCAILSILHVLLCNPVQSWQSLSFRFLCAILSALIPVISTELQPDVSFPIIYGLRYHQIMSPSPLINKDDKTLNHTKFSHFSTRSSPFQNSVNNRNNSFRWLFPSPQNSLIGWCRALCWDPVFQFSIHSQTGELCLKLGPFGQGQHLWLPYVKT